MPIKGLVGQGDRVPSEERLLTLAAAGAIPQSGARNAIDGLTVGADYGLERIAHFGSK